MLPRSAQNQRKDSHEDFEEPAQQWMTPDEAGHQADRSPDQRNRAREYEVSCPIASASHAQSGSAGADPGFRRVQLRRSRRQRQRPDRASRGQLAHSGRRGQPHAPVSSAYGAFGPLQGPHVVLRVSHQPTRDKNFTLPASPSTRPATALCGLPSPAQPAGPRRCRPRSRLWPDRPLLRARLCASCDRRLRLSSHCRC